MNTLPASTNTLPEDQLEMLERVNPRKMPYRPRRSERNRLARVLQDSAAYRATLLEMNSGPARERLLELKTQWEKLDLVPPWDEIIEKR